MSSQTSTIVTITGFFESNLFRVKHVFEESLRKMRRFPLMRPPSVSTMSKICKAFEAEDIHADEAWDMLPLFYLVVKGDAYSYCASETFDDAGIVFGYSIHENFAGVWPR